MGNRSWRPAVMVSTSDLQIQRRFRERAYCELGTSAAIDSFTAVFLESNQRYIKEMSALPQSVKILRY